MKRHLTLARLALGLAAVLLPGLARAQDLMQQLNQLSADSLRPTYVQATFKGTRVINGQSVETPGAGSLVFLISHRFGALNSGAYNFFGLDQATIRLGRQLCQVPALAPKHRRRRHARVAHGAGHGRAHFAQI
jgi:hypothetical protein